MKQSGFQVFGVCQVIIDKTGKIQKFQQKRRYRGIFVHRGNVKNSHSNLRFEGQWL